MPASDILVYVYSLDESVGSSIPLVILSNTETEMTIALADIPAVIPEVASEAKAAIVTSPTNVLDLTIHSDTEATAASHSSSSTSTPPTSLYIVCASPGLPHLPVVLVLPGQEIPLDNHKRSRYVSSSSSSSSPCKRRRVSPHLSSLASHSSSPVSVGPSRKRFRSPTTDLSPIRVDLLPLHKRLRDSPFAFPQEVSIEDSTEVGYEASIKDGTEIEYEASIEVTVKVTVEVVAELDTPPILPEETLANRLDGHKEVTQEMYDHLLETPLQRMEEVKEETRTLTSRHETAKTRRTTLRDRVRSLELHEMSLRDTLRVERERGRDLLEFSIIWDMFQRS
nr:hypothetical protein [Tanacetum cinerariifolium]